MQDNVLHWIFSSALRSGGYEYHMPDTWRPLDLTAPPYISIYMYNHCRFG